jgi:hypothetical protein
LGQVADAAKAADVACEIVQIEHGQPYQAIITAAKDKDCDVIVMASHGRSGISALLLGSVTHKVLTHTKIPVLVCRWVRAVDGWAVPAASPDRPLLLQLPASCCIAANRRSGPRPDNGEEEVDEAANWGGGVLYQVLNVLHREVFHFRVVNVHLKDVHGGVLAGGYARFDKPENDDPSILEPVELATNAA